MTQTPADKVRRQWLFLSSKGPWASAAASACTDLLMTAAVFGQDVQVVFLGEGVLQLLPEQDGTALNQKTLAMLFPALELYDVHKVHVEAAAIAAYGLDSSALLLPVTQIDCAGLQTLVAKSDVVYVF